MKDLRQEYAQPGWLGRLFRTDTRFSRGTDWFLTLLPFVLLALAYLYFSARLIAQGSTQTMPSVSRLWESFWELALKPAKGSDMSRLMIDSLATGYRFIVAMVFIFFLAPMLGLLMGMYRIFEKPLGLFVVVLSMIPPMTVAPIYYVLFGIGDVFKIALTVSGVFPMICLTTYTLVKSIPRQQVYTAQSLNFSEFEIAVHVILPQVWPKVLETIRLSLVLVLTLLLATEGIAANEGIGFYIVKVQKRMAMDEIIPYMLWSTFWFFLMDQGLRYWIRSHRWMPENGVN